MILRLLYGLFLNVRLQFLCFIVFSIPLGKPQYYKAQIYRIFIIGSNWNQGSLYWNWHLIDCFWHCRVFSRGLGSRKQITYFIKYLPRARGSKWWKINTSIDFYTSCKILNKLVPCHYLGMKRARHLILAFFLRVYLFMTGKWFSWHTSMGPERITESNPSLSASMTWIQMR